MVDGAGSIASQCGSCLKRWNQLPIREASPRLLPGSRKILRRMALMQAIAAKRVTATAEIQIHEWHRLARTLLYRHPRKEESNAAGFRNTKHFSTNRMPLLGLGGFSAWPAQARAFCFSRDLIKPVDPVHRVGDHPSEPEGCPNGLGGSPPDLPKPGRPNGLDADCLMPDTRGVLWSSKTAATILRPESSNEYLASL